MTKRELILSFLTTGFLFVFIGIYQQQDAEAAPVQKIDCDCELKDFQVNTIGNSTYISIELIGTPWRNQGTLLRAKCAFEQLHPDWEVTLGYIDARHSTGQPSQLQTGDKIYGIWLDHKPKNKK